MLQMLMMSRRCRHVMRVLQSYLDCEVDAQTADVVAAHLEECRRCGLEAATYEAIKVAIASRIEVGRVPVDPATLDRLHAFVASLEDDGSAPES